MDCSNLFQDIFPGIFSDGLVCLVQKSDQLFVIGLLAGNPILGAAVYEGHWMWCTRTLPSQDHLAQTTEHS